MEQSDSRSFYLCCGGVSVRPEFDGVLQFLGSYSVKVLKVDDLLALVPVEPAGGVGEGEGFFFVVLPGDVPYLPGFATARGTFDE